MCSDNIDGKIPRTSLATFLGNAEYFFNNLFSVSCIKGCNELFNLAKFMITLMDCIVFELLKFNLNLYSS